MAHRPSAFVRALVRDLVACELPQRQTNDAREGTLHASRAAQAVEFVEAHIVYASQAGNAPPDASIGSVTQLVQRVCERMTVVGDAGRAGALAAAWLKLRDECAETERADGALGRSAAYMAALLDLAGPYAAPPTHTQSLMHANLNASEQPLDDAIAAALDESMPALERLHPAATPDAESEDESLQEWRRERLRTQARERKHYGEAADEDTDDDWNDDSPGAHQRGQHALITTVAPSSQADRDTDPEPPRASALSSDCAAARMMTGEAVSAAMPASTVLLQYMAAVCGGAATLQLPVVMMRERADLEPVVSWTHVMQGWCGSAHLAAAEIASRVTGQATRIVAVMLRALQRWLRRFSGDLHPLHTYLASTLLRAAQDAGNAPASHDEVTVNSQSAAGVNTPPDAAIIALCSQQLPFQTFLVALAREVILASATVVLPPRFLGSISHSQMASFQQVFAAHESLARSYMLLHAEANAFNILRAAEERLHRALHEDAMDRRIGETVQLNVVLPLELRCLGGAARDLLCSVAHQSRVAVETHDADGMSVTALLTAWRKLTPVVTAINTAMRRPWTCLLDPSSDASHAVEWRGTALAAVLDDTGSISARLARIALGTVDACRAQTMQDFVDRLTTASTDKLAWLEALTPWAHVALQLSALIYLPSLTLSAALGYAVHELASEAHCSHENPSATWMRRLAADVLLSLGAQLDFLALFTDVEVARQAASVFSTASALRAVETMVTLPVHWLQAADTSARQPCILPLHSEETLLQALQAVGEWLRSALLAYTDLARSQRLHFLHRHLPSALSPASDAALATFASAASAGAPQSPAALLGTSVTRLQPVSAAVVAPVSEIKFASADVDETALTQPGGALFHGQRSMGIVVSMTAAALQVRFERRRALRLSVLAGIAKAQLHTSGVQQSVRRWILRNSRSLNARSHLVPPTPVSLPALIHALEQRQKQHFERVLPVAAPVTQSLQPSSYSSVARTAEYAPAASVTLRVKSVSSDHSSTGVRHGAHDFPAMLPRTSSSASVAPSGTKPVIGRGLQPLPGVKPSAWWSIDAQVDVAAQKERERQQRQAQRAHASQAPSVEHTLRNDRAMIPSASSASSMSNKRRRRRGARRHHPLAIIMEDSRELSDEDIRDSNSEHDNGAHSSESDAVPEPAAVATGAAPGNRLLLRPHDEPPSDPVDQPAHVPSCSVADQPAEPATTRLTETLSALSSESLIAQTEHGSASIVHASGHAATSRASGAPAHCSQHSKAHAISEEPVAAESSEALQPAAAVETAGRAPASMLAFSRSLSAWRQLHLGSDDELVDTVRLLQGQTELLQLQLHNEAAGTDTAECDVDLESFVHWHLPAFLRGSLSAIQRSVVRTAIAKCGLVSWLWSIRAVFCFEQGNVMASFLDKVFDTLWQDRMSALLDSFMLTRWLQSALSHPGPHLHSPSAGGLIGGLQPAAFSVSRSSSVPCDISSMLAHGIVLQVSVPDVLLDAAFPIHALQVYRQVSAALLRIKYTMFAVEALSRSARATEAAVHRTLDPLNAAIRRCKMRGAVLSAQQAAAVDAITTLRMHLHRLQLHRHTLQHFVRVLHDTTVHGVVCEPWKLLSAALATGRCADVEALHAVHAAYLRMVARRCLLDKDQMQAQAAIAKLLTRVQTFAVDASAFYCACVPAVSAAAQAFTDASKAHALFARFDDTRPRIDDSNDGSVREDAGMSDARSVLSTRSGRSLTSRLGARTRWRSEVRHAQPGVDVLDDATAEVCLAALSPLARRFSGVHALAAGVASGVAVLLRALPDSHTHTLLDFNGFFAGRA